MQRFLKIYALDKFGPFCMALQDDHIPFDHRGFRTVSVYRLPDEFPAHSRRLYEELRDDGLLEESQDPMRPWLHRLVSTERAKALLKEWTHEWQKPLAEKVARLMVVRSPNRETFQQAIAIAKQQELTFLTPEPLVLIVFKDECRHFAGLNLEESEVQLQNLPPESVNAVHYLRPAP